MVKIYCIQINNLQESNKPLVYIKIFRFLDFTPNAKFVLTKLQVLTYDRVRTNV